MGRIRNAFTALLSTETRAASSSVPLDNSDALKIFGIVPSAATGIAVTAESAMRCPPFAAAVRAISNAIAQCDAFLYSVDAQGGRDRQLPADHPAARVLERPNPWTGAALFQRQLITDVILAGNAIAVVVRAGEKPRELHRLVSSRVSIRIDDATGEPRYEYSMPGGGSRTYGYRDILHLRGPSTDGIIGRSVVTLGAEAIGLALLLERHGGQMFSRAARPGGLLKAPGKVNADTAKRLAESFDASAAGQNAGKTVVLEENWDYITTEFKSTDAQYLENRTFQVRDIARLTGVPPVMLADLEFAAQRSNTAELNQAFLNSCIAPILEEFEDNLERILLSEEERDRYEIEFDVSDLTRADVAARFASYKSGVESGVLTINQAKQREGLPPIGEAGDRPMHSVQVVPIDAPAPASKKDEPA
jgi:HK97 family phage portal protein